MATNEEKEEALRKTLTGLYVRGLGSTRAYERDIAARRLKGILDESGKTWADLLDLVEAKCRTADVSLEHRNELLELHIRLGCTAQERDEAHAKILIILQRYRKNWSDLLGIIGEIVDPNNGASVIQKCSAYRGLSRS
jgi:hypothetical protein